MQLNVEIRATGKLMTGHCKQLPVTAFNWLLSMDPLNGSSQLASINWLSIGAKFGQSKGKMANQLMNQFQFLVKRMKFVHFVERQCLNLLKIVDYNPHYWIWLKPDGIDTPKTLYCSLLATTKKNARVFAVGNSSNEKIDEKPRINRSMHPQVVLDAWIPFHHWISMYFIDQPVERENIWRKEFLSGLACGSTRLIYSIVHCWSIGLCADWMSWTLWPAADYPLKWIEIQSNQLEHSANLD